MEAGPDTLDRIGCELVAGSIRAGHEVRIRVAGISMVPALWPGDELLVRALGPAEPSRGDLILFVRDGRLCTHRLVGRVDVSGVPRWITRGDAALKCDPPNSPDQILGSVVSVFRDGHQVPVASPRFGKMLSFGIRHSGFLRRVVLKIHAMRFSGAATRLGWLSQFFRRDAFFPALPSQRVTPAQGCVKPTAGFTYN